MRTTRLALACLLAALAASCTSPRADVNEAPSAPNLEAAPGTKVCPVTGATEEAPEGHGDAHPSTEGKKVCPVTGAVEE